MSHTSLPQEPLSPNPTADREKHVRHESGIRACGFLYLVHASVLLVASILNIQQNGFSPIPIAHFSLGLAYLVLSFGFFWMTSRLFWPIVAASVLGLWFFPLGTLAHAHILLMLMVRKGRRIFRRDYRNVISSTPDIEADDSSATSLFVVVVLVVIVAYFFYLGSAPW